MLPVIRVSFDSELAASPITTTSTSPDSRLTPAPATPQIGEKAKQPVATGDGTRETAEGGLGLLLYFVPSNLAFMRRASARWKVFGSICY